MTELLERVDRPAVLPDLEVDVHSGREPGVVDSRETVGVARVKRNLWRESWVGAIATLGDPLAFLFFR